jgi:hypothetical protein
MQAGLEVNATRKRVPRPGEERFVATDVRLKPRF